MKKVLIVICLLLALAGCSGEKTPNEPGEKVFRIGILQLVKHEALDEATRGFKDALTEKLGDKVVFDDQNASGDTGNCATIANQFVSEDVDLIFANATPALQACATATDRIPIVGTSVTSYKTALNLSSWNGSTGTNVTGTSDLAPLDAQAAQVLEILPDAEKVSIFFCSSEPNSVFQADEIEQHFAALGLETKRFTFTDSNDIAQVADAASEWGDAVYIPTDNMAASYAVEEQFFKPVVAGEAGLCKSCGTVTVSISYYDIGRVSGEMAADILLNGADPATMTIRYGESPQKMYNPSICGKYYIRVSDDYVSLGD